ncbi:MAG: sigma-70 family RNA polymerase sigma factor [Deltaproteobacteria bacterium]
MVLHSSAETAGSTEAIAEARAELPEEFDRLYAEHFEFIWRSLRRLGVKPEDLDDAVQDVFIVFLRRRSEFRGQSSQRTWLFGIANNVAHEYRRKQQRAARAEPMTEGHPAHGPSPLDQASSTEALRLVDAFLASLDDNKRNVFILAELEQMSAPEIATALGVKLNTVYSRLRVAREAFFAFLQQSSGQP